MVGHPLRGHKQTLRKSPDGSLARARRCRQPSLIEALEARLLLSGSPTIFTVNSTDNGTTGTGDSGTLPYVIGLANANTNTAGSEIEFDPTVFATSQTITLASTLTLSETAGPEVIDGPGASIATVSGGGAVEVLSVTSGVTASLTGLTISGGSATQGGGVDNAGTLTITTSSFIGNTAGSGGAISNTGVLSVASSTFADNLAYGGDVNGSGGNGSGGRFPIPTCCRSPAPRSPTTRLKAVPSTVQPATPAAAPSPALTRCRSPVPNFSGNFAGGGSDWHGDVGSASGGAIFNTGLVSSIDSSTLSDNEAVGGLLGVLGLSGPASGAGIYNVGAITVSNSAIMNNSTQESPIGESVGGGGIENGGTMTVTNSTIAGNSLAISYEYGTPGGGIDNNGTMTVSDSTIADNSAQDGGGINNGGTLSVTNSTIAYNNVTNGDYYGGGFGGIGGGIDNGGALAVANSTIAGNSAEYSAGGIAGAAALNNTIIALNTAGDSASDIADEVSGAFNLIGTGGSGGLINGVNGNQVGVANPGLGPRSPEQRRADPDHRPRDWQSRHRQREQRAGRRSLDWTSRWYTISVDRDSPGSSMAQSISELLRSKVQPSASADLPWGGEASSPRCKPLPRRPAPAGRPEHRCALAGDRHSCRSPSARPIL